MIAETNVTTIASGEKSPTPQEGGFDFHARFSQKNKNLGYKQDMPATKTLDTDLRKYFGFGKKSFKTIVKRPGVKFGFKLSNYIHPTDSVETVNKVLQEIAEHIEFTKASPVKEVFNTNFKDELRAKYFARKPEQFLVQLHFGATFRYQVNEMDAEGKKNTVEKVDTNRGIHMNKIVNMSPTDMKNFRKTYPRSVWEYHAVLLSDYYKNVGGIGPHNVLGDTSHEKIQKQMFFENGKYSTTILKSMSDIFNEKIKTGGYGENILDFWLEAPPIIVQQSKFTKDQFIEDELMERASVLFDNFLKHAGGINIKAKEETEGKCVENQLLEFFLNPGYTDAINKIPESFHSECVVDLNATTLKNYLDSIPKSKNGNGFSTRQLAMMCVDIRLNMYALDYNSNAFMRVTQFTGVWPRGQSGHNAHHPLVFYCANKHFYLITHPQSIKSIVETCKEGVDSRDFQETDENINESLVVRNAEGNNVSSLLEGAPEGHYIMEQDSLEEEVFDYMEKSGCAPKIQLKDNKIIGFTVSEVVAPKPIPPVPLKPKRSDFTKGKKGQPDYEKALATYNQEIIEHKKACLALKNSQVSKSHKTYKFECNPNFLQGFPHEAVKIVCEKAGIPFHNQGLGSLALELIHIDKTMSRVDIPKETKESLLQEQECKCANDSCGTTINFSNSQCDHIKPLANGGSNEAENLQMLCISCHKEKCAAEKEEGYGGEKFPDYHSQFSPSVFEHVVKHIHPLAFVELTDSAIKPMKAKVSRNEQKEKVGTIFTVQKDTSGQDVLDNITKGSITYEKAIKSLEILDEIYHSRESKNRIQFVKNRYQTLKTSTLDGSITHQIQPQIKKHRKLGAEIVEMKQTRLKETYYTDETLKKMADWQIDFKGQYPNLLKYREHNWPKFSVMDAPRPFSGKIDQEKAGWFYVVTLQKFPFRGSSWYPVQTVILGLNHKLIFLDNIKYEWIPSTTLAKNHFVSYLDRIDQAFTDLGDCEQEFTTVSTRGNEKKWTFKSLQKAVKCSLVGAFAQKERHSEWVKATLSPALASSWVMNDGTDQECFVSQPLSHTEHRYNEIYVGQFKKNLAIESSGCIIRAEILEASSREMFYIEHATKNIGGTPLWRKTDAIGGMGPCIDISTYYWDEEGEVPKLQFEDPAPPKDERKPREVRESLEDCIFHYFLGYKWFIDSTYDGSSAEFAKKLIESKRGFFLNGRAGVGKTTLANAIIDVLESLGIKYLAFSTTHVSKKRMGSDKSQLRVGKHANTIDSLYRRWRHNQQFVITALQKVEYLLVDEISMMREKFYAMLCHIKRAIPGMKIILIGDFLQFMAVKDSWCGDYENSSALFDLCDGYKVHLTKCLREDGDGKELFNICTDIINGKEIDTSMFPVTEETEENIAFYHKTRIPINEKWMSMVTKDLPESKLIKLDKIPEDDHSQDVTLCENMPVICIRKSKSMGVDNGERFTIMNFSDVPDYSAMKKPELKQHCKDKGLKRSGNVAILRDRLQNASSDILLRLTEDSEGDLIRVPRHLFQKHFYVAYAITYYQSQGCTIKGKYTIHDWYGYHTDWRAKYVALSRATNKANVQIVAE